jgi:PAS domain S-box-containing protein
MVNAETRRVFGYPTEGLIGRPVEVLLPAALHDAHVQHRGAYVHHPGMRTMGTGLTLDGARADGTTVPVEVMLSPCDVDGRPHVIAVVREVAERRAREHAAEQDLADRRLLFELGEFARVTDDLRALAREVAQRVAEHRERPADRHRPRRRGVARR